jgi:uncharacterized protein (UPF0262 family)
MTVEGGPATGGLPSRIVELELDERSVVRRKPEVEHERQVAIYDLIENNFFRLQSGPDGPYRLHLAVVDNRLRFDVRATDGVALAEVMLPLSPFRRIVKDYFMICESYYDAIKRLSPSQIEAIDMGRRALHNEGSELLRARLAERIEVDDDTARRLFTLVCVLHIRA